MKSQLPNNPYALPAPTNPTPYFYNVNPAEPVINEADRKEIPNPSKEDLDSPFFEAIYGIIKSWDVAVPEYYNGYCGANGSHAKLILDAIMNIPIGKK
jgi:hypothetical protein